MKKKNTHIQLKPKSQVPEKKDIEWANMGRFKLFLVFAFIICFFYELSIEF